MPETLEATVDRIRWSNRDTGWAVIQMMDGSRRFVAVGDLAHVEPGEALALEGAWKESRYGWQFETTDFRKVRPSSALGIIRFLSGIPGIGWELAKALVDHWGEDTLAKLEAGSEVAQEVPGIGPMRALEISQAVAERSRHDDAVMELQALGIGNALAARILDSPGPVEKTVARVKSDPYALRKLDGVGFTTADQIAGRLGFESYDPRRIDAALVHALEQAGAEGHCCLPPEELLARTSRLLEISRDKVQPQLARMTGDGRELRVYGGKVYGYCWHAERQLARRALELLADPAPAIPYVKDPGGLRLSEEQQAAVELALRSKFFILTGGPGTGKTTITRAIVRSFVARGLRIELASPTGRAAQRLQEATGREAATIHRLLEYHPIEGFRVNRDNPLDCDALIVDEVSMLDVFLARRLLNAVMDGCRVIFVGDADQLPSVGPGRVLCDLIESGRVPTARLTRIFRQAETSHIVRSAHRINRGEMPEAGTDPATNDLFISLADDPDAAAEILIETVTARIPRVMGFDPQKDIQVLTPMKKGALGVHALNRKLRDLLNPNGQKIVNGKFRVGDRVMQMTNNYTLWAMNGEVGRIVDHKIPERKVSILFEGDVLKEYTYSDLTQLSLAYACTIHKSQGSEYPCVVIALHRYHHVLLQRDLLYTAVTRAKKLAVIIGCGRSIARAVKTVGGNGRHTGLSQRLREEEVDHVDRDEPVRREKSETDSTTEI